MGRSLQLHAPCRNGCSCEVSITTAQGATIYVARVNSLGETRLARPCLMCIAGLSVAGIRDIVYTDNDGGYRIERLVV